MELYHCSPTAGLTVLEPSVAKYSGKPRQVCLTASLPMALMYGIRHFEYTYGYTRAGRIYYEEYFPDALEQLYRGKSAWLYRCALRPDMERTAIPNEYVTPRPVPVLEGTFLPDVCAALLEQERAGALDIYRWPLDEKRRRWIVQAELETILEHDLLHRPDSPFARFQQTHYPDSWALAQAREKENVQ